MGYCNSFNLESEKSLRRWFENVKFVHIAQIKFDNKLMRSVFDATFYKKRFSVTIESPDEL